MGAAFLYPVVFASIYFILAQLTSRDSWAATVFTGMFEIKPLAIWFSAKENLHTTNRAAVHWPAVDACGFCISAKLEQRCVITTNDILRAQVISVRIQHCQDSIGANRYSLNAPGWTHRK